MEVWTNYEISIAADDGTTFYEKEVVDILVSQKDQEILELLSFIKKVAHSNPSETTLKYINEGCDLLIKHQKE